LTTMSPELTLARPSFTENRNRNGHHVVESSIQCSAWQPRRGGGRMAGVGLFLSIGSPSRRGRHRRVSDLAGAYDWNGLGLGHSVAGLGKSRLAHRDHGSGPFDYNRTNR
jgi:hypothetical protein